MSKNIILLSDGTGNSTVKNRGTNVFKLYEAIDYNSTKPQQIAFYDDGVGNSNLKPLKILGGAFGWGLARNVRHLYKELVQAYAPGDKIYLFGFSRGAFTVRTLAGFICKMGILDSKVYWDDDKLDKAILECYQKYRSERLAVLEKMFYKPKEIEFSFSEKQPTIEFIGAWDTVDAVGFPVDEIADFWNRVIFRFKFPDHKLNDKVNKACHALALDEERRSFHPLLWLDNPRIEQVWFPGAHSDVGGGYPQQGMSLVTLDWMMRKAEAAGVKFTEQDINFVDSRKYSFDKTHDSRSGLGMFYRYQPRKIVEYCADNRIDVPEIHDCVFERIAQGIFGYAPVSIPNTFEVVDNKGKHKKSAAITKLVSTEAANSAPPSLMGYCAKAIIQRKTIYLVFVIYALITLYWLVRGDLANPEVGVLGTLKILVSPDGLLDKLYSLFWHHKIFVLVGAGIYGAGYYVRQSMEDMLAGFWSKLRPELGALLKK